MHVKQTLPWWARIGAKIVLSRLPVPYSAWKKIGLYEHGDMEQPSRAWNTFIDHAAAAGAAPGGSEAPRLLGAHPTVLELGPGDSLYTAVIAKTLGAAHTWLVDAGPFAVRAPERYRAMGDYLQRVTGLPTPALDDCRTLADVLAACHATYLTQGVASLLTIPNKSVDFCYSNAVLEHIPLTDLELLARELHRVLKPGGTSLHRVDLQDHLGGGLNNLRFSAERWEGDLFRKSGFYTNRVRFGGMVRTFEAAGFIVDCPRVRRFDALPIAREKMAPMFRALPADELLVSGFDMRLRLASRVIMENDA